MKVANSLILLFSLSLHWFCANSAEVGIVKAVVEEITSEVMMMPAHS
jgi:hypothetical protein